MQTQFGQSQKEMGTNMTSQPVTTVVKVPDAERNQTIYRMNQEGKSPSELAAMFRLSPRSISRILQSKGKQLVTPAPPPLKIEPGALRPEVKPYKPMTLVMRRNPVYPKACVRCRGTMEVDTQYREARCLSCGWDPLLRPNMEALKTEFCDGGGANPDILNRKLGNRPAQNGTRSKQAATSEYACPECGRRVELSNHGTVPPHKAVKA